MSPSPPPRLIVASTNAGKIKEFRRILGEVFEVIPLSQTTFSDEIEETGATFFDNALLKAKAVYGRLGVPVLADDSGLCVEALDGAPGVYSARYGGAGATAADCNALLLKNLEGVANRSAKFVACIVLYFGRDKFLVGNGETAGRILTEPDGTNGFGYDPIFFSDELGKSFGQACADEKNAVSHRGRALADLLTRIANSEKRKTSDRNGWQNSNN
ncbi:MAG: RdgB/HAM1 family non-canonical purine NTP pyrophosphatase [Firmicutes bacterium]|nr:RdgB/HAM1 family non-canonical purine NTP pyrophosphatase [Bacillota bacterium]